LGNKRGNRKLAALVAPVVTVVVVAAADAVAIPLFCCSCSSCFAAAAVAIAFGVVAVVIDVADSAVANAYGVAFVTVAANVSVVAVAAGDVAVEVSTALAVVRKLRRSKLFINISTSACRVREGADAGRNEETCGWLLSFFSGSLAFDFLASKNRSSFSKSIMEDRVQKS